MRQVFDASQVAHPPSTQVCIAKVERAGCKERYLRIAPPCDNGDAAQQIRAIYDTLFETLQNVNASPQNLIAQKCFFSDLAHQYDIHQTVRQQAYDAHGEAADTGLGITYLQQPPAIPGRCVELQARVVIAGDAEPMAIRHLNDLPGPATGSVMDYRGQRHIHLQNLTGESDDFATQAGAMFDTAEDVLQNLGASFHDVVRTWIYLDDLEGDYNTFNPVRTDFFNRIGIARIPASTGIQGGTYPPDRACMMDLYALQVDDSVRIAPMHARTMNEAPEYGSSFSRGMTVTHSGQTTAYVSGTASIDDRGEVVHLGDIEGQAHRMFQNVETLLDAQGASLGDVVSAVTYLKQPDTIDVFNQVAQSRGLPHSVPNTITIADVCRPEWLCEIEVIAVFPQRI